VAGSKPGKGKKRGRGDINTKMTERKWRQADWTGDGAISPYCRLGDVVFGLFLMDTAGKLRH
jgi:hypothetical protein